MLNFKACSSSRYFQRWDAIVVTDGSIKSIDPLFDEYLNFHVTVAFLNAVLALLTVKLVCFSVRGLFGWRMPLPQDPWPCLRLQLLSCLVLFSRKSFIVFVAFECFLLLMTFDMVIVSNFCKSSSTNWTFHLKENIRKIKYLLTNAFKLVYNYKKK